jgi:hypothetical protein
MASMVPVRKFSAGSAGASSAASAQQIDEVATVAATGVQYLHPRSDVAPQELVEDVDVDLAELVLEGQRAAVASFLQF